LRELREKREKKNDIKKSIKTKHTIPIEEVDVVRNQMTWLKQISNLFTMEHASPKRRGFSHAPNKDFFKYCERVIYSNNFIIKKKTSILNRKMLPKKAYLNFETKVILANSLC